MQSPKGGKMEKEIIIKIKKNIRKIIPKKKKNIFFKENSKISEIRQDFTCSIKRTVNSENIQHKRNMFR